jgi:hypothetical protein
MSHTWRAKLRTHCVVALVFGKLCSAPLTMHALMNMYKVPDDDDDDDEGARVIQEYTPT